MKSILIIWAMALAACVGTYAYIYVSIGEMCKAASDNTASGIELKVIEKSKDSQTHNPQQTINDKELQGGNL